MLLKGVDGVPGVRSVRVDLVLLLKSLEAVVVVAGGRCMEVVVHVARIHVLGGWLLLKDVVVSCCCCCCC